MRTLGIAVALLATAGSVLAAQAQAQAQAQVPPPPLAFVFEEVFDLTSPQVVGDTPAGRRQNVTITGGRFSGPGFSGRVLPGGGDYQLIRPDGAVEIDAEYLLETDDHIVVHARHLGTITPPKAGGEGYFWSTHSFDAPSGKYGWMNGAVFVSRIGRAGDKDHPAVRITVWKVG